MSIRFFLTDMRFAIELHYDSGIETEKINDVMIDWLLASELEFREAAVA